MPAVNFTATATPGVSTGSLAFTRYMVMSGTAIVGAQGGDASIDKVTYFSGWEADESQKCNAAVLSSALMVVIRPPTPAPSGYVFIRRISRTWPSPVLNSRGMPR